MSILGNSCSGLKKRRNILFAGFIVFGIMSAGMGIVKSFAFYLIFMGIYGVCADDCADNHYYFDSGIYQKFHTGTGIGIHGSDVCCMLSGGNGSFRPDGR